MENEEQGKMSFNNTYGNNTFVTPQIFSYNNSTQNKIFEEKPFINLAKNTKIKKKYSERKVIRSFYVYYALKVNMKSYLINYYN
jgi:hypothetical protein